MSGAQVLLVVNIAVASLFAAGYAIIALTNRSQRAAMWLGASYLLGMLAPACDLFVPSVSYPELLEFVGYVAFLGATLSISATFNLFHRKRPPWGAIGAILAGGLALRLATWGGARDSLAFGTAFQLPFALAAILATRTVVTLGARRPLYVALAAVFAVIGAHFMIKPWLAVGLGSGRSARDYIQTTYALISQSSTGILLLAAGLLLLLIVAQKAITEQQQASETDPLSGLANRRGFDRLAQEAIARAGRSGLPVSAAMFDLDHFKAVNDRFGHDTGDAVIGAFAALLDDVAPRQAVLGRMGGEEFVLLVEGATADSLRLAAEGVRLRLRQGLGGDLPAVSVSGGVAELRGGESLAELLRRTDHAAYRAKDAGRDRICVAGEAAAQPLGMTKPPPERTPAAAGRR